VAVNNRKSWKDEKRIRDGKPLRLPKQARVHGDGVEKAMSYPSSTAV
jgi:hypothetical protein